MDSFKSKPEKPTTPVAEKGEHLKSIDWDSFTHKISEEVTVAQSPMVGFSKPPTFWYTVIETGEKFTGNTGRVREDYMSWRDNQKLRAELQQRKKRPREEEPMDCL